MDKENRNRKNQTAAVPISLYFGEGAETGSFFQCCDENINIIMALQGNAALKSGAGELLLEEGELKVINRLCPFWVKREVQHVFLILKLDSFYYNRYYPGFSDFVYKENGACGDARLRRLIAYLVQVLTREEEGYRLYLEKEVIEIGLELCRNYRADTLSGKTGAKNHVDRIAAYIGEHYREPILLSEIAAHVHLNEQYLSRHFSSIMEMTVSEYINIQRLYHSLEYLKYSDDNILEIALQCGFPNAKSYYKVFKEHFGGTPSEYRSRSKEGDAVLSNGQLKVLRHQALEKLYRYIEEEDTVAPQPKTYHLNLEDRGRMLNKTWNRILAFGKAADGLKAEMRDQLMMLQREIPFGYVRFHGILSDEMGVYQEDGEGSPFYNFNYVDDLIDFLRKINLKPYIELGYMPDKLAAGKEYLFAWHANISPPKSMDRWKGLIKGLLYHLFERYGREEVRTWYFEIWNDPDLKAKLYPEPIGNGFPFLKMTYESIREADRELKVGGINTFAMMMNEKALANYFRYFKKENISLDFISLSLFGARTVDPVREGELREVLREEAADFISPQNAIGRTVFEDMKESRKRLVLLREQMAKAGFKGELIINEWNLIPDPRELINDTCFKAAYFAAGMLMMDGLVQGAAYWTFSDIFDEVSFKEEMFHGGIGFITRNGLKKPIYYVYEFLNRLSGEIIAEEDCFMAVRSQDGTISILLYQCCELIDYRFGQRKKTDNRYSGFRETDRTVLLNLQGCDGFYTQNYYRVNRREGCVYDTWLKMGAPERIQAQQLQFLKSKSIYHLDTGAVSFDGCARIPVHLLPHEVALIELIPMASN